MAHDLVEEFRVSGKELVSQAREILEEGNVRRMIIKNSNGETVFKLPLTFGIIGVGGAFALAPILSSIAAFAFFARDARILVERYPRSDFERLKNELSEDENSARGGKSREQDPYEIDADFEILDP